MFLLFVVVVVVFVSFCFVLFCFVFSGPVVGHVRITGIGLGLV